jgi:hypothetical protein
MTNEYDFTIDKQKLLLQYMLSDPASFAICQRILRPEYFDDSMRSSIAYVLDYADTSKTLPMVEQIKANTGMVVEKISEVSVQHSQNWFLPSIEKFCRHRALELAVLEGVDLINEGRGAELEKLVKDAVSISLQGDMGTDYFTDPTARLEKMRDRTSMHSTGWASLDKKLYGGFGDGSLHVFAGGSGSGKSIILQNIALNWAFLGKHVIYFSLELGEEFVSLRLDAMVAGMPTSQVFNNIAEVALTVRMKGMKTGGSITIKKLPEAGTNANTMRGFIKEWEIKTGRKLQGLCVDYLDLIHPNNPKINPSDLFVKDKYTSEELRALAGEFQVPCASASQLNRGSVEASEFDQAHIAGGISKINTADGVYAIYAPQSMKERGEYQLQFLKTRSAASVGQKITLTYNPETMLLTDRVDEIEYDQAPSTNAEIRDTLKKPVEEAETKPDPIVDIKSLMNRIKYHL